MPFHRGVAPIRRTLKYLEKGTIVFKERVKVMTVNYNELHRNTPKHTNLDQHQGARDFVFWNLPQVRNDGGGDKIGEGNNLYKTLSPSIGNYHIVAR